MAFLAFLVSCLVKKDRPEQHHEQQHHEQGPKPFLSLSMTFMSRGKNTKNPKSPKTPKSPKKRANTSDLDGVDDEEVQRAIMIRKSLASRASSRTCTTGKDKGKGAPTPVDVADVDDDSEEGLDDEEEGNPASLKSDWKAYEADLQRNRSVLIRRHPGIDRSPDSAGSAPLTPSSSTCSATPTTPMTPMTSLSIPSVAPSPRASPVPRQHTFPCASISRKPVPPSTDVKISEEPVAPSVERAAT